MDCNNCGSCCVDQVIPLNALERMMTPNEHKDASGKNLAMVNGHCVFFDPGSKRCMNYENRPAVCRDFRAGCGRCVIMRAFVRSKNGCRDQGAIPHVNPGSFGKFASRLHMEQDAAGNIIGLAHPEPTEGIRQALDRAHAELPSEGW